MISRGFLLGLAAFGIADAALAYPMPRADAGVVIPAPALDEPLAAGPPQRAVLAGGCFWGVQGVFQHVNGVVSAVSGYAGGTSARPAYAEVSRGTTGHAESVEVIFDPAVVSYGQILRVFFSVAHDPTEVDRQGPDEGPQYRSAVFTLTPRQAEIARAYIAQLDRSGVYPQKIATAISPLPAFFPAEDEHQDYMTRYPWQPYIVVNDAPKLAALRRLLPAAWRGEPMLTAPR
jgi:peptide-methionine (S)-S-oxide reductase